MKKPALFYYEDVYAEHGHNHTAIRFFEAVPETLADAITGCIGNKAGYGTKEAADRLLQEFTALMDRGHTHHVQPWTTSDPYVTVRYLHFTLTEPRRDQTGIPQYCRPALVLGDDYAKIKRNLKFAEKVMRKAAKLQKRQPHCLEHCIESPQQLVAALQALKAVRVEHPQAGPNPWNRHYVHPTLLPSEVAA